MKFVIPEGYKPQLSIKETEIAIKEVKDFERELAKQLNLIRVSAPLFVKAESGLNDNLSGVERPVAFGIKEQNDQMVEIVHSLAKWKRQALKRYGFELGEGLYTDMYAIRRDEETDNIHSILVDQWDWEKIINKSDRNEETLKDIVRHVYKALKNTEIFIANKYDYVKEILLMIYTLLHHRSLRIAILTLLLRKGSMKYQEKKAVFIMQIGGALASGKPHDGRAPDYDDWKLNGDIIVYYPVLDIAMEFSSMGIRVDEESLKEQLTISSCLDRAHLPFKRHC